MTGIEFKTGEQMNVGKAVWVDGDSPNGTLIL